MTVAETGRQRVGVASPVMRRINALPPSKASAVEEAIRAIGHRHGEVIDLPNARPGAPYLALPAGDSGAPVVIYRATQSSEKGDWLVVGLLTDAEFRQQKRDERDPALHDPVVRASIATAVGTAASVAVTANPGTPVITVPGAAPTTSGDPVPGD